MLPSVEIAGQLIGPVLDALHWYGAVAGTLLALLAWALGRGRGLVLLSLAAAALCAFSQLGITPRIAMLRPLAFGPQGSPEIAARFHQLHQVSVMLFVGVGVATLILLVGHVRADLRPTRGIRPSCGSRSARAGDYSTKVAQKPSRISQRWCMLSPLTRKTSLFSDS